MFIDIHTHKYSNNSENIIVPSFRFGVEDIIYSPYTTAAIHPWDVGKVNMINDFEKIVDNLFMIAETGLDKLYPDFEMQKQMFIKHLELGHKYTKTVVVHAVKSHNEILSIIKSFKDVKLIIHSFIGSNIIAEKYIECGCSLSFSPLSLASEKGVEILRNIPHDRLFLESDNANITIQEQYEKTADVLRIDLEKLKKQIENNFNTLCLSQEQNY